MSNTSIAAPAIRLFFNTLIKACSSTIGPRDALISRAVGFILSSSAAPTRPRVRLLNTKWIVRMSARANSSSLETRIAPAAMIARGGDIDRRVSRSRRGNEPEIGNARNDVAGQRGPLAHDTNDIKRQQPLNQGVRSGDVVLKYGDVRSIVEHRPIGALKRHILVIVQNSDLVLLHWHPSRGDCFEPSPPATSGSGVSEWSFRPLRHQPS